MKILDRSPFATLPSDVVTPDGVAEVKSFQIIVWVSLTARRDIKFAPGTPRFPAILDTGTNHNFTIRREQFDRWTGLSLPRLGQIVINGRVVPLLAAHLWIHPNAPREAIPGDQRPFRLKVPDGIAVYPADVPNPARLPILGLRALVTNRLKLIIDGQRLEVTLMRQRTS